jgi:hypothetical protein
VGGAVTDFLIALAVVVPYVALVFTLSWLYCRWAWS